MRIENAFHRLQRKYPDWTTFTCFAKVVVGSSYTAEAIFDAFRKLVDKDDYSKSDTLRIKNWLIGEI